MYPIVNIFGKEITTYAICALIGILVSGFYVCRTAKKRGHDDNDFIIFLLICSVGVLIGGRVVFALTRMNVIVELITNWSKYVTSFGSFIDCMSVVFGGSVFYGGLIGGMIFGVIYGKIKKLDLSEYANVCAPMVPVFLCFGRIGCFLGGCCYGIESSFGFTAYNNDLIPDLCGVNRFPVQLLEAGLNFLLFLFLDYLLRKNKFKGNLFALYLVIYAVIRFSDEFLRGDQNRGFLFGLSTSQIISIILFVCGGIYLIRQIVKQRKQI